jgi:hypothetical protein
MFLHFLNINAGGYLQNDPQQIRRFEGAEKHWKNFAQKFS